MRLGVNFLGLFRKSVLRILCPFIVDSLTMDSKIIPCHQWSHTSIAPITGFFNSDFFLSWEVEKTSETVWALIINLRNFIKLQQLHKIKDLTHEFPGIFNWESRYQIESRNREIKLARTGEFDNFQTAKLPKFCGK